MVQTPEKNPHIFPPDKLKQLWAENLKSHTLTEEGRRRAEALRSAATAMTEAYIDMVPAGREQAIALADLEKSLIVALQGIERVHNTSTSEPQEGEKNV